jgi:hypothetical protein
MRELLLERCPALVREQLSADRPLLLGARNSDGKGAAGRRLAAQNAHVLAQSLFDDGIIDVRDLIPPQQELERLLEMSEDRTMVDGDSWRFVEWRSPDRCLMLVVSQGSGRKVDDQDLQVFMERLRSLLVTLHPVALWTHEGDRMGRDEVGALRLVRAIESNRLAGYPCELGFGQRGALSQHDGWDIPLFFEARQARLQAASLQRRTREAMRLQTGSRMVDGRFPISLPNALPAGLGRTRLVDGRGTRRSGIAYLDSPEFRPTVAELVEPLHLCLDDDGEVADQVANVQWALVEMANGRPSLSIGRRLAALGFSTTGLARKHGQGATFRSVYGDPDAKVAGRICRRITQHLDFYETGILRTRVGGEALEITHCLPPDDWMTPEVAAGARDWVARRAQGPRTAASKGALCGMTVTVNGAAYRLISNTDKCDCDEAHHV